MNRPPVGLQSMILGKRYDIHDPSVLDRVAASGFTAVEAGAGSDPAGFKAMLQERGMEYGGMHTTPQRLGDCAAMIDTLGLLDGHDVCSSGVDGWAEATVDDYRRTCDALNEAGTKLRAAGIHLHYHNHAFEFGAVEGGASGMDLLLEHLDPHAVDLCVDVGWVDKAGVEPVAFLREHAGRIGYLHLKDHAGEEWAELGRGDVDIKGVVDFLPQMNGVRWAMYEQDASKLDPMECVGISGAYLKEECGY